MNLLGTKATTAIVQDIEDFVAADPYKQHGLVTSYSIKPYMVVVGGL